MKRFTKEPQIIAAIISVIGTIVGTLLISILLGFFKGELGLGPVVFVITFLLLIAIWVLLIFRWGLRVAGAAMAMMVVVGSVIFLIVVVAQMSVGVAPPPQATPVAAAPTATEAIPTPTPVVATGTPVVIAPTEMPTTSPVEGGERLEECAGDICIVDHEGGRTPLGLAGRYVGLTRMPSWSPDGSTIVFAGCPLDRPTCHKPDLFLVNRDGSNPTALLSDPDVDAPLATWSPDGEWIACGWQGTLSIIRPDGVELTTLMSGCVLGVAWSPDSQRIAWETEPCTPGTIGDSVWIINRDGSEARLIFQSFDVQLMEQQIAWSPDGESVAVTLENVVSYLIDADCHDLPNGCDESSRTEIDAIPEHWLHNFYPQWAGE